MNTDTNTHTAADAGRFDRMHNGIEESSSYVEDDRNYLAGMTKCPRKCGAHFHGKSTAYYAHLADHKSLWNL